MKDADEDRRTHEFSGALPMVTGVSLPILKLPLGRSASSLDFHGRIGTLMLACSGRPTKEATKTAHRRGSNPQRSDPKTTVGRLTVSIQSSECVSVWW